MIPKMQPALWTGAGYVASAVLPNYVPIPQKDNPFVRMGLKIGAGAVAGGIVGKTVGKKQGAYVALGGAVNVAAELVAMLLSRAGVSGMADYYAMDGLGGTYVPQPSMGEYDPDLLPIADAYDDNLAGSYIVQAA